MPQGMVGSDISPQADRQGGKIPAPTKALQLVKVTLPINVKRILLAMGSSYTNNTGCQNNSGQVYDFTQVSFEIVIDNGAGIWLAISIQTGWIRVRR